MAEDKMTHTIIGSKRYDDCSFGEALRQWHEEKHQEELKLREIEAMERLAQAMEHKGDNTANSIADDEQPRQTQQPKKKRGRPIESLEDCMINDEDGSKLECLRKVMRGKKGKKAALMILACMEKGWMTKPTYGQVATTFGDIGRQQGFTQYLDERRFSDIEIKGAMEALS